MHSLSPVFLSALRYNGLQLASLRALGEYRGKQKLYVAQSPEMLADLKQVAVVESIESSNRLEGVVVAPSRLKSLVIRNAIPKSRSSTQGFIEQFEQLDELLVTGASRLESWPKNFA